MHRRSSPEELNKRSVPEKGRSILGKLFEEDNFQAAPMYGSNFRGCMEDHHYEALTINGRPTQRGTVRKRKIHEEDLRKFSSRNEGLFGMDDQLQAALCGGGGG